MHGSRPSLDRTDLGILQSNNIHMWNSQSSSDIDQDVTSFQDLIGMFKALVEGEGNGTMYIYVWYM